MKLETHKNTQDKNQATNQTTQQTVSSGRKLQNHKDPSKDCCGPVWPMKSFPKREGAKSSKGSLKGITAQQIAHICS